MNRLEPRNGIGTICAEFFILCTDHLLVLQEGAHQLHLTHADAHPKEKHVLELPIPIREDAAGSLSGAVGAPARCCASFL